jgi:hypothetical protein
MTELPKPVNKKDFRETFEGFLWDRMTPDVTS